MGVGRYAWAARRRLLGPERVVTKGHVQALSRSGALGALGRVSVNALHLRELALGPPSGARVAIGDADVELGPGDDFPVDWKALVEIVGAAQYAAPYPRAHVLDVGAHKGYFGAYALFCGASIVLSYEPAATNFRALERSAAPFGSRWPVANAALGAYSGAGTLFLDRTSWAHSLYRVERPAGQQPVAIVTLAQALSELPEGGSRTIVKIDAEGSECDILATSEPFERIDVLMVEWHPAVAPCRENELIGTIRAGGLTLVARDRGVLRFARSAESF